MVNAKVGVTKHAEDPFSPLQTRKLSLLCVRVVLLFILLGNTHTDKDVESIFTEKRHMLLASGERITIQ